MERRRSKSGTCLVSEVQPKIVKEELDNGDWITDMNEEIDQIEKNKTWSLVPRPKDKNVIGTKWVFRKKLDENGEVTRNKDILVCKGYAQEEGIDYGEKFAPISRLEGVRTFLVFSTYEGFKVYQIDAKSAFFNGILEEEVYIEQP